MAQPRILCINPWIYDFAAFDFWSKPLGLLYIAAYLRQHGLIVDFIDCLDKWHPELLRRQNRSAPKLQRYGTGHFHREIVSTPEMLKFIPRRFARYGLPEDIFHTELLRCGRPDMIFLTSFMTYWYPGLKRIVEICRSIYPGVPLVLGGIYASLMPEHAQVTIKPDYLITGPGEYKAAALLAGVFNIPELIEEFPIDIDKLPYPAFDLLRKNDYLVTTTSRGCPFRCSFCATYKVDSTYRQREPENVVEEIGKQSRDLKVNDVAFYDDVLIMHPETRIKPMLRMLLQANVNLRFHTPNGLHGRFIDEELADLMYRCKFKTIRISLESIAKERLKDINNKITPDEMTRAVKNLVQAGFRPSEIECYIIMGLPGQPVTEVVETILFANRLGVQVRLASYSPIPGTPDYQKAIARGLLPEAPDPLLTNKTIIPLQRTREAYLLYQSVRKHTSRLNQSLQFGKTDHAERQNFKTSLLIEINRYNGSGELAGAVNSH